MRLGLLLSTVAISFAMAGAAIAQQANMTFFITSSGPGKGADLGGLAGAHAHCQHLAQAAGAGGKNRAGLYLSTPGRLAPVKCAPNRDLAPGARGN